jgi:hypothetical protein
MGPAIAAGIVLCLYGLDDSENRILHHRQHPSEKYPNAPVTRNRRSYPISAMEYRVATLLTVSRKMARVLRPCGESAMARFSEGGMNMNKHRLALAAIMLAGSIGLGLSGCGGDDGNRDTGRESTTGSTSSGSGVSPGGGTSDSGSATSGGGSGGASGMSGGASGGTSGGGSGGGS